MVRLRPPGGRFTDAYVLADDRPCDQNADACAALDMDSAGNLISAWAHAKDTYRISRRSVDTGYWSTSQRLKQPGYALYPHVDLHANGDAVAWIDTEYGSEDRLWTCAVDADCKTVPYPAREVPGVFVAGPGGSATAAFGDEPSCDDWCYVVKVLASRLNP